MKKNDKNTLEPSKDVSGNKPLFGLKEALYQDFL